MLSQLSEARQDITDGKCKTGAQVAENLGKSTDLYKDSRNQAYDVKNFVVEQCYDHSAENHLQHIDRRNGL